MKRALIFLVLFVVTSGTALAEFPEKIIIGKRTIECMTVKELREIDPKVADIPWKDNAARVLVEAMNAYEKPSEALEDKRYEGAKAFGFGEHADEVRAHLAKNEHVFRLLKQAEAMPRCVFPMHRAEIAMMALLPQCAYYQQFARALQARAVLHFAEGKHAEAIEDCLLAIRLGRRLHGGYCLIEHLVALAVEHLGTRTLDRIVASGKLTDAALASLAKHLNALPPAGGDYARAMRYERWASLRTVDDIEKYGPEKVVGPMADITGKNRFPQDPLERLQWRVRYSAAAARKNLNEVFDFIDAGAKKSVREALKPENNLHDFFMKHLDRWDPLTRILMPAYPAAGVHTAKSQAEFDALRLRIALERHKLARKKYPDKLDALTPKYLAKVPIDPFSGKPYRYRLDRGKGFLIWSIGEDLKDNNGESDAANPWKGPDYTYTAKPK